MTNQNYSKQSYGKILKDYREKYGVKALHVSCKLGMAPISYASIENGKKIPSEKDIIAIEKFLKEVGVIK